MSYNKLIHIIRCCEDLGKYADEMQQNPKGFYASSKNALRECYKNELKFREWIDKCIQEIGESEEDEAEKNVKRFNRRSAEKTSEKSKQQDNSGKSKLYRDAIKLYSDALECVANCDYDEQWRKDIAGYLHEWFQIRIVELCGKGKSQFVCGCNKYGVYVYCIIKAFAETLKDDESRGDELGTKFAREFNQWIHDVRYTDKGRNSFAVPITAWRFYTGDLSIQYDDRFEDLWKDLNSSGLEKLSLYDVDERYKLVRTDIEASLTNTKD